MIDFLTVSDIPAAMQLVEAAGWNQTPADWQRVIEYQPHGCFKAVVDGQLAGTVTSTSYGRHLAWIGMMLVDPALRRQGIGRSLMQRVIAVLQESQVQTIKLDATPVGRPLYEQLGFVAQFDFQRWHRPKVGAAIVPIKPFTSLAEALELDRHAFGVDRYAWLERLANHSRVIVGPSGVGMIRSGRIADYLGPVNASCFDAAASIIEQLVSSTAMPVFWDIPQQNAPLESLARQLGFEPVRLLTRMSLGEDRTSPDLGWQYAIGDPGTG